MESEIRNCINCSKDFTIESEDFNFYEKIKVPPPTWCPECRQTRRYAWRNERTLYRRNCDLCNKSMVTIYSPNKPHKVYCTECWWGDNWDSAYYGRDFDFNRPFFEQFRQMQLEVPRLALLNKRSVNSEYTNHSGDNKNVYLSFSTFDAENVFYSTWIMKNSRDLLDCTYIYEAGEKLYNVIDSRKSYQCQYGILLKDCVSTYYSYDMHGCSNCFLSHNLRNKSYCFKNIQYSREEYLSKVAEYDLGSRIVRDELYKEYTKMLEEQAIHRYSVIERCVNSEGSLLFDTKNVKASFEIDDGEDSKYCYGVMSPRTSFDLYHVGYNLELDYECQGCTRISNCQFCHLCYDNLNVMYGDTCQNSQNLFGCISIKKGEYMIFNKKYPKAEYETLKAKIIDYMKQTGEFGEFFPPAIAPVCYNETQGQYYLPMTKEETLAHGWQWEDKVPGTFGKETISSDEIPDNINVVEEDITSQILSCTSCKKNYNLHSFELAFYKSEHIPVPTMCPDCRYRQRFAFRLPRKLWSGKCRCTQAGHAHEGNCKISFQTPYAPERKEKVYCESCYNKELY